MTLSLENIEDLSNEDLLHLYRIMYKHKIGTLKYWKKLEDEILNRMTREEARYE